MKISAVQIREFKRFAQLNVSGLSPEVKLVVLVGPNGSGKSSLFEALNAWHSLPRFGISHQGYHARAGTDEPNRGWDFVFNRINVQFHGGGALNPRQQNDAQIKRSFYFRTAYRHEADFTASGINRLGEALDDPKKPAVLVLPDTRVSDNYQRLVGKTMASVFEPGDEQITKGQLRDRLIGRVRASMARVFPNLTLSGVGDPMTDGTFTFDKGSARNYRYINLSGGEKAAFDLLLDFVVKSEVFNDTVYCIDEPEIHIHTRLQGELLEEIYRQIPANCQLWIATHSIGMMHRAMQLQQREPTSVAFLDFEGHDFDQPVSMVPVPVNRALWKRVFRVALDELADLVAPSSIILCEGSTQSGIRATSTEFDAKVYRTIFGTTHPDTEFVSVGASNDAEKAAAIVGLVLGQVLSATTVASLVDRDDRSEEEVRELSARGIRVLRRRTIESYLWDDAILRSLCSDLGFPEHASPLVTRKNELLAEARSRGRPADDVKGIAGALLTEIRRRLPASQLGNSPGAFALSSLAPRVIRNPEVYNELEQVVFGSAMGDA